MKSVKTLLGAVDDNSIPEDRFERAEEIVSAKKKQPKVTSEGTKLILTYTKKNNDFIIFEIDRYVKSKENLDSTGESIKESLLLDIEEAKQKLEKFYAK